MTFNELNSVEHYIIQQLSGTNLNRPGQEGEDFSYTLEMTVWIL